MARTHRALRLLAAALLTASAALPAASLAEAPAAPEPVVQLRSDAPLRYLVRKGDTLWDIAAHFLQEPWQWPEIWYVNEQVRNPHLIYPGDLLTLAWRDGRPVLSLADGVSATEKLTPRVRESALAVPTLPIDAIRDFLRNPRLVDAEALKQAPYLLSFVDPRLIEAAGSQVYVQDLPAQPLPRYEAIRLGQKFVDPETGELLGWEGTPIGLIEPGHSVQAGQPALARIASSYREARVGDRLIAPPDDGPLTDFHPHPPAGAVGGRILAVQDAVSQAGQYQVVTLNRGSRDGIERGHVMSILQTGRKVADPYGSKAVQLPQLYAGTLMVFKVETRVSYALVMKAVREIHVLDQVERPQLGEGS